jgi:hypothetical protein
MKMIASNDNRPKPTNRRPRPPDDQKPFPEHLMYDPLSLHVGGLSPLCVQYLLRSLEED